MVEFVNGHIREMAEEFVAQAMSISDYEPMAAKRKEHLYRGAGYLLLAMAETSVLSELPCIEEK